jgi:predicted DNA-binding protein (UPF0251 family)
MISEVIIDDKIYVILPKDEFEALQLNSYHKIDKTKLMSIDEAESCSIELITKWAQEKSQFDMIKI